MGNCGEAEKAIETVWEADEKTVVEAVSRAGELLDDGEYTPLSMAIAGSILLRSAMLNYYLECRGDQGRAKCMAQTLALASCIASDALSKVAGDLYEASAREPSEDRLDPETIEELRSLLSEA